MTIQSLRFIKEMQRSYKDQFGEDLIIDFPKMKGCDSIDADPEEQEMYCCLAAHAYLAGVTVEQIRSKNINITNPKYQRERKAMLNFIRDVRDHGWDQSIAGALLNRNRTIIPYYIKQLSNEAARLPSPSMS